MQLVEDFHVVRYWGLVVIPYLEAVKGYRKSAASVKKVFLKWANAVVATTYHKG